MADKKGHRAPNPGGPKKLMQLTRAEIMDITDAVESHKKWIKRQGFKFTAADESRVRRSIEKSIAKRRESGY